MQGLETPPRLTTDTRGPGTPQVYKNCRVLMLYTVVYEFLLYKYTVA